MDDVMQEDLRRIQKQHLAIEILKGTIINTAATWGCASGSDRRATKLASLAIDVLIEELER